MSSSGSRGHLEGANGNDWGLNFATELLDNSPRPLVGPGKRATVLEDSPSPLMPVVTTSEEPSIREGAVGAHRKTTSPPRPAPEARVAATPVKEAAAENATPGDRLGTWAGRQRVFADFLREEEEQAQRAAAEAASSVPRSESVTDGLLGAEASSAASAGSQIFQAESAETRAPPAASRQRADRPSSGAPAVLRPSTAPHDQAATPGEDDELNMAWRWRFTRKWQVCRAGGEAAARARGGPVGGRVGGPARRAGELVLLLWLFCVGMCLGESLVCAWEEGGACPGVGLRAWAGCVLAAQRWLVGCHPGPAA